MTKKIKARKLSEALANLYPDAICSLDFENPLQLIISTLLSAQCMDERVNIVTKDLFARYKTFDDFAQADYDELCEMVRSCGFYRNKAKNIIALAQRVRDKFGGQLPDNMEDLLTLAGVGRKTANLFLGTVFNNPGIVADTHCIRLSNRFGLCDSTNPDIVERQLNEIIPKSERLIFCHRLIYHGRAVCKAQRPNCGFCTLSEYCGFVKK